MVARVLVTSTSIRVSKPGVDVNTAQSRDLLLSIGQRCGQILATGSFNLSLVSSVYQGTGFFGPFSQIPQVIGYVRFTDGKVYPASGQLGLGIAGPSFFASRFDVVDMTITSSSIFVKGGSPSTVVTSTPAAFHYVIYRKPWKS